MSEKEREFEVGKDEAWFANIKRTFDEYQDIALTAARRSQDHYDATMAQVRKQMEELHQDARRRADLAVDRQWNVDEQGYTSQKILAAMQDPAVIAAMAAAIAKAMADMVEE
jgi:hypothetical protein